MTIGTGPRLGLIRSGAVREYWYPESQALFQALDALLFCAVLDKDLAAPPGSPADGALYIVAGSPTGAWTGHAKSLAYWNATAAAWAFYAPLEGFSVWVTDEATTYRYTSGAWGVNTAGNASQLQGHPAADFILASVLDTDGTLAANSAAKIPAQSAVKTYVDAKVAGLSWKQAVRFASTANGTLATAFENGDTMDGGTLATGDRFLLKDQSAGAENGIYTVNASGAPTRATDADSGAEMVQATVYVQEGTANADTEWTCTTNAPITLGSTALAFAQRGTAGTPSGSAGGSLGGTYPNPTVTKINETGGPTTLTIGAIADGEYAKRVGTTLVGGTPSAGGSTDAIAAKSANYTTVNTDDTLTMDASGGAKTFTLVTAVGNAGLIQTFKKIDSSVNTVTIDGNSSETIDGKLTWVLRLQRQSLQIQSDGANWVVLAHHVPVVSCLATSVTTTTTVGNTSILVVMDTEVWDTHAMHDLVTNNSRIVAPCAGRYRLRARNRFANTGTGVRFLSLFKNSGGATYVSFSQVAQFTGDGGIFTECHSSLELAAGDYVEIQMQTNDGGNRTNQIAAGLYPEFEMTLIDPMP